MPLGTQHGRCALRGGGEVWNSSHTHVAGVPEEAVDLGVVLQQQRLHLMEPVGGGRGRGAQVFFLSGQRTPSRRTL